MSKNALETRSTGTAGIISRVKNTSRVFVAPNLIGQTAVTGTWALETNSSVVSLGTDDAGDTNVFIIPLPVKVSDAEVQGGSGTTDRGVKVIGIEVLYQVASSALGAFDLDIYKLTINDTAISTAAEVTTTLSFDTSGDAGTEVDTHRAEALIAARDRFFLDSGNQVFAQLEITDGTSSDVNIFGAIWHLEVHEE